MVNEQEKWIPSVQRGLLPVFAVLYFVCSLYVMIPFMAGAVGSGYTGLDSYPYGTPSRPMVYRVLMPNIAKVVRAAVPQVIEKPLTERLIQWRDSDEGKHTVKSLFFRPPPLANENIFETAVVAFVCYLTFMAFIAMFYHLTRALFPDSTSYALLAPVIMLQLLPALMINNAYIYDFSELFFSCALFYLLLKQRWSAYLCVFAIATFNKETTIFCILIFATYFVFRLPRRQFIFLLAQQCVLYLMIKGGLTAYFANYPGELIGPHVTLMGNIKAVLRTGDIFVFAMSTALMGYRWKEKPAFLRGGVPMILAHTAIFFAICVPYEYRDFYWSLPFMVLYATHSLIAGAGLADHPIFRKISA